MNLRKANKIDARAIAMIHTASWRDAYRPFLDAAYLAGPVEEDRLNLWIKRFSNDDVSWDVTVAETDGALLGFVCTFGDVDPKWGSLLDNLHVLPHLKRSGIGTQLFRAAASWVVKRYPSQGMHLWVFEGNEEARTFYSRMGGTSVERAVNSTHGGSPPSLRYYWPEPSVSN